MNQVAGTTASSQAGGCPLPTVLQDGQLLLLRQLHLGVRVQHLLLRMLCSLQALLLHMLLILELPPQLQLLSQRVATPARRRRRRPALLLSLLPPQRAAAAAAGASASSALARLRRLLGRIVLPRCPLHIHLLPRPPGKQWLLLVMLRLLAHRRQRKRRGLAGALCWSWRRQGERMGLLTLLQQQWLRAVQRPIIELQRQLHTQVPAVERHQVSSR